ncbi:MAG: VTT domain-containing protein [Minisyncoccia bacterium]
MELSANFAQVIQDMVLRPDSASAFALFTSSLINELFPVSPYSIVLSSQMLFLKGSLSLPLISKLLILVSIPVGVGTALGALPVYGVTYLGGKPAIDKFGKYLRLSWSSVERIESKFDGSWYDEVIFLALRSIPLMPYLPVTVAAGIMRMPLVPYFLLTTVGATIRMMIMFLVVGFGVEALAQ